MHHHVLTLCQTISHFDYKFDITPSAVAHLQTIAHPAPMACDKIHWDG